MLWPQSDGDYQSAESDFPEGHLSDTSFSAFAHYGGSGAQDAFDTPTIDTTQWHVYTQEWGPGFRNYYVDGKLVGTSTNQVTSLPERWQLQVEPSGVDDGGAGHALRRVGRHLELLGTQGPSDTILVSTRCCSAASWATNRSTSVARLEVLGADQPGSRNTILL